MHVWELHGITLALTFLTINQYFAYILGVFKLGMGFNKAEKLFLLFLFLFINSLNEHLNNLLYRKHDLPHSENICCVG